MSKPAVIIADSSVENTEQFSDFLNMYGYELVAVTQNGYECIDAVRELCPDVVISGIYLYDFDICDVYKKLMQTDVGHIPVFVAASSVSDSSVINRVLASGIDMFTLMPTDFSTLDKRIRKLVSDKNKSVLCEKTQSNDDFELIVHIKELLHELGVYASIQGYTYILDAVVLAIKDRTVLSSITKQLYPKLAQAANSTPAAVERSMRHAIEKAWQNGSHALLCEIFGYTVSPDRDRPSNGQFVSMVAERVKRDLKIS